LRDQSRESVERPRLTPTNRRAKDHMLPHATKRLMPHHNIVTRSLVAFRSQNRFDAILEHSSSGISFGALQKHQPNPRLTMPRTCLNCKAAASKDVPILCCGACRSAVYCSRVSQKEHWKEHKNICKFLNVGEGGHASA
jgi:hypothetical protein